MDYQEEHEGERMTKKERKILIHDRLFTISTALEVISLGICHICANTSIEKMKCERCGHDLTKDIASFSKAFYKICPKKGK